MKKLIKFNRVLESILTSDVYTYVIIPFLIFLARILDVSLGTMRVIFVSKGFKLWAPVLGFFEILIWLAAIRQVLANLSNVPAFLAYALGFSMGNYVGMWVEEKLSVGKCLLRIHIAKNASKLFKSLTKANYPLTVFNAKNRNGSLKVISLVVKRQTVPYIIHLVEKYDPHVIYSIEDVRYATESRFVKRSKKMKHMFMPHRKGK